jgi:hypothetical protein
MKTLSRSLFAFSVLGLSSLSFAQQQFLPGPEMAALDPATRYQGQVVRGEHGADPKCTHILRGDNTRLRTVGGEATRGIGGGHPDD